jgi:cyclophilin family peptidyl-prolyl cis-trans isomerase
MKLWQQLLIVLAGLGLIFFFTQIKNHPPASDNSVTPTTQVSPQPTSTMENSQKKSYSQPPELIVDKNSKYTAVLDTSKGQIVIQLFTDKTPITANNFIFLTQEGFYDDTIFHRIIKDFMIQGGDPTGTGTGGPGYQFADESFTGSYDRGMVAMANAGPNTNGSQFFIMHQASPNLPKNYVIFGQVIEGLDTLDAIANVEVEANPAGELSQPIEPVILNSVTIQKIPQDN